MSTDFSIRPVGIPAPAPIVATPSPAANEAVQTELPASQTVAAGETGASVRNDLPHAYAEPLVGLIQYQAVRITEAIPFWAYEANAEHGIFLVKSVTQSLTNSL